MIYYLSLCIRLEKFLSMPIEEKRNLYKSNVNTLDGITTWAEYWTKKRSNTDVKASKEVEKADEELAEKVSIWQGDITTLEIDAIVNAANSRLVPGGGGRKE